MTATMPPEHLSTLRLNSQGVEEMERSLGHPIPAGSLLLASLLATEGNPGLIPEPTPSPEPTGGLLNTAP